MLSLENGTLWRRLFFTALLLVIFRLGVHIPIPGVNTQVLAKFAAQSNLGLVKVFNTFSGGALSRFSLFSLATMPYISSSIIVQLMTIVLPSLEQLQKEGAIGRRKLNRITRFMTVFLGLVQGYLLSAGLESARLSTGLVFEPGMKFRILSALLICAGSCLVMWLGEQITENGIGNGISLLIFSGIVAYFPSHIFEFFSGNEQTAVFISRILSALLFALTLVFLVSFVEMSYRKLPVQHARKMAAGNSKMLPSQMTYLPLKVNMSGVMAAIFASTALAIPVSILSYKHSPFLDPILPEHWLYNLIFVCFGFFFTYFYSSVIFKPDEIAENLKKQSAYIPNVRPGRETSEVLSLVSKRLCFVGALYLSIIVVIPGLVSNYFGGQHLNLGGTSLLIVVGVGLDAIRQIKSYVSSNQYGNLFFKQSDQSTSSL